MIKIKKQWKKIGEESQNERFKTNPKFELMIKKEQADSKFIVALNPIEKLGFHRYKVAKQQVAKSYSL